jgi:WD40 repeat protein
VLIHRYPAGLWSVAFASDGTLYALTIKGELWAHPPDGWKKVLVARATDDNRLQGKLDISPDGRWLSVSGYSNPTLFRIGAFEAGTPSPDRVSQLRGWEEWLFPRSRMRDPARFTGDSAYWVGPFQSGMVGTQYRAWKLPDVTEFEYRGFRPYSHQIFVTVPNTGDVVFEAWSSEHNCSAIWKGDPNRPDEPVALLGTVRVASFNDLEIGADNRFYIAVPEKVLIHSLTGEGFRRDATLALPGFTPSPKSSLSADGTRFVACHFRHKIVYAGRTDTGEVGGPWDWKIGDVNDVAIAPDGLTAAAAGSNKKVAVWDLE